MQSNNLTNNESQTHTIVPSVFDKLIEPVKLFIEKQNDNLPKHPGEIFF